MCYAGFTERITKRYGIVVKNWPLERFENPSSISTGAAVETLLNSWISGTTYFYRMSTQEFKNWLDAFNANALEGSTVAVTNAVGDGQGSSNAAATIPEVLPTPSPTPVAAAAPAPVSTGTSQFVPMAMVTDTNGVAIAVRSNTRKKRSDAGKPRKKRGAVAAGGGSTAT